MSEWIRIGRFSTLEPGFPLYHNFDYETAVVYRVGDTVYAIEDRCSHDDGPLGEGVLDGCQLVCPRHGARFDIRNGKALSMPAVEDVASYPIKVEDDFIFIQGPEEEEDW